MDNYSSESKRIWVTLFDHLDDDMYDGDFTYDDPEIPRILLEYKEASSKPSKTTHRVTESAAKSSEKKEVTRTITTTTRTYTSSIPSSQKTSSQVTYTASAQFEIGAEPQNSSNCNKKQLEEELRANTQNTIADLRDEQQRRFAIEDDRVAALGFLHRAHEELKGEHAQDLEENRRLQGLSREIDTEIATRRTKISAEIDGLKQLHKDVDAKTKETQAVHDAKTKENKGLQSTLDKPEDLSEQGFSKEAKDLRTENSHLKNQFEKNTSTLISERDQRDKFLNEHSQTVTDYTSTVHKYHSLLLQAEQARKIHLDNQHSLAHQLAKIDEENDHLEQRLQITDIDIDSLTQAVDSLRKDYTSSDKVFSSHITELSEILVEQDREIAELKNQFNNASSKNKELQNFVEKQKLDLQEYEREMDEIRAIGYEEKMEKLLRDLKAVEDQRRQHQDQLENAHEALTTKLQIFKDEADKRRKLRQENEKRVSYEIDKLADVQKNINELLKDLDRVSNKIASDANKDTVDGSLKQERDNHKMKLRWATEERDIIRKDLSEALQLYKSKEQEVIEQEERIRQLKAEIAQLKTIIEEKKRIIAELEREIEKANERIEYLVGRIRDLDSQIAQLERALYDRELRLRELSDILGAPQEVEINYRAVKGDEVDEMLAQYLQDCPVPVKRLGGGFYLFGTRKIYAKIMNGKLVVRVGGGYMFISEFIATYSEPEIAKLTKICEKLGIDSIWDLDLEELYFNKSGGGASPMNSPGGRESSPKGNASFKKSLKNKSFKNAMNGTARSPKVIKF